MLRRSKKNTFLTHYLFAKMAKFFQTTSQFPLFRPFFCKTKVFWGQLYEFKMIYLSTLSLMYICIISYLFQTLPLLTFLYISPDMHLEIVLYVMFLGIELLGFE